MSAGKINNCRAWIETSDKVLVVIEQIIKKKGNDPRYRINIPGGAVSIYDTSTECTAFRELFEETYDIQNGSMLPFNLGQITHYEKKRGIVSNHNINTLIHKWKLNEAEVKVDTCNPVFFTNKETQGMLWLDKKQLKNCIYKGPGTRYISGHTVVITSFCLDIIKLSLLKKYIPRKLNRAIHKKQIPACQKIILSQPIKQTC